MFARSLLGIGFSLLIACGSDPQPNGDTPAVAEEAQAQTGDRIRIVASNLTSGDLQSYDPGDGARILRALDPDVVLMQEFNYGSGSDDAIGAFVSSTFGADYHYFRDDAGQQIPNGIVSRFPIKDAGSWDDPEQSNREFAWASIDIPGDKDLLAVSVHLAAGSSRAKRTSETQALIGYITQALPQGGFVVIGGDFNTTGASEPCFGPLQDAFNIKGPYPVDQAGNKGTNASRAKQYDWVLTSNALEALMVPVELGGLSFPTGLVVDTRVFDPLSVLAGTMRDDSGASNMQHMAVVRDFRVTGAAPQPPPTEPEPEPSPCTSDDECDSGTVCETASGECVAATPPPATRPFLINEFLANELGSDTSAEFVEIYNTASTAASIAGYTLSDSASVRHVFPSGSEVPAHGVIVVYGRTASTGTLALSNGGDSLVLKGSSGVVIDSIAYSGTLAIDGVSATRKNDGDESAGFVPHNQLSDLLSSPGARLSGTAF